MSRGVNVSWEEYQIMYARTHDLPLPTLQTKKRKKWNHTRCEADGFWFDSLVERERYYELKLLEKGKLIADLHVHPKWCFVRDGKKIGTYTADFSYFDLRRGKGGDPQALVVEDVKNPHNVNDRNFRRNIKLMEAHYNIIVVAIVRDSTAESRRR